MSIINDVKEYLIFVSQVKNLSINTTKSYERDLKKLCIFLNNLNVSNYSDINADICSAWIGDLYSQNNNPRSIQRHLSSAKGFFRFLKKNGLIKTSPFELVTAPKDLETLAIKSEERKLENNSQYDDDDADDNKLFHTIFQ